MTPHAVALPNDTFWRRAIETLRFDGQCLTPEHAEILGDPCPANLRVLLRAMLRESFRNGNRAAPLQDALLDVEWFQPIEDVVADQVPGMVSILIPVRGAHDALHVTLDRLLRCTPSFVTQRGAIEVVIACAEDERDSVGETVVSGLGEPIAKRCVSIATSPTAQGYPANINLARRHARGDILVTLNSDAFVTDGWLEPLLTVLEKPHVVAAGPSFQIQPQGLDLGREDIHEVIDAFGDQFTAEALKTGNRKTRRLVGFCCAMRAWAFDRVGGVSEAYGTGNWDDDDLSLKLLLCNGTEPPAVLATVPAVRIVHPAGRSFAELPDADLTYRKLLRDNEQIYLGRWGWILPQVNAWLDECGVDPAQHNVFKVDFS